MGVLQNGSVVVQMSSDLGSYIVGELRCGRVLVWSCGLGELQCVGVAVWGKAVWGVALWASCGGESCGI